MDDQILPIDFPTYGVDMSLGLSEQRPQTCAVGTNVRLYEPVSLRSRGGSRPGTIQYIPGQVSGTHLIQMLNTVVYASYAGLAPVIPTGNPPVVDDPSSPGSPGSWGTGTLYFDPNTGLPVTGAGLGTRVPGGGGGPAMRPEGGTGNQPNKNILSGKPPPGPGTQQCCQGVIGITITNPPPDPFGWNGQQPAFIAVGCVPPSSMVIALDGQGFVAYSATVVPFGRYDSVGGVPTMKLKDYISLWLSVKVGSHCYGTIIADAVSPGAKPTSPPCTIGQLGSMCQAPPPTEAAQLSEVGSIITP